MPWRLSEARVSGRMREELGADVADVDATSGVSLAKNRATAGSEVIHRRPTRTASK